MLDVSSAGACHAAMYEQIRCAPLLVCPMLHFMEACALCGATGVPLTDEDVIPKWALRAFNVQGPVTIQIREEGGSPEEVGESRRFKLVLEGGLCQRCNNVRLSQLENKVKPILAPMAVECRPTSIDANGQRLLAIPASPSGSRLRANRRPASSSISTSW